MIEGLSQVVTEDALQGVAGVSGAAPEVLPLRVLSAERGELLATDEQRELVCLVDDGKLYVSGSHRLNDNVLSYIAKLGRLNRPFVLVTSTLEEIAALYARSADAEEEEQLDSSVVQEQVVAMIRDAARQHASDIHIINRDGTCRIRARIDGWLEDLRRLRGGEGMAIVKTIYQSMLDSSSGDEYFMPGKPQEGRLKESFVSSLGLSGLRVATTPLDRGHWTTMRLLYKSNEQITLEGLGYLPEQKEQIELLTQMRVGINVLSGETGSGKSMSLKASLELADRQFDGRLNIITFEDPPEYSISGTNQVPVINGDWQGAISGAMRRDPNIIMIGEMRDLPSAQAAFRAAMTGHGVWTTLHANDCCSALERLQDIGVEMWLLTDPTKVTSLMNQALVRKLCDRCSVPYEDGKGRLTKAQQERYESQCNLANARLVGPGCKNCRNGIAGRTLVAEIVIPDMGFMDTFKREGKNAAREYWRRELKGITKTEHCIRRINHGWLDPLLAEKDIGYLLDRRW